MKKIILAFALFTVSWAANAITVQLVRHNQTSGGGAISSLITDGSHVGGYPASNAVWDWDGTTLSSIGLYSATSSISSNPAGSAVLNDQITDLTIDTGISSAGGTTAYACFEGTFLSTVGASGCGGYNLGSNFVSESTTTWGPGLATSQTIGGDDVSTGTIRDITAYDFGLVSWDGTTLIIGNGIPLGSTGPTNGGGEEMEFTTQVVPVPAAAWLFGSALGLLGWARRRAA